MRITTGSEPRRNPVGGLLREFDPFHRRRDAEVVTANSSIFTPCFELASQRPFPGRNSTNNNKADESIGRRKNPQVSPGRYVRRFFISRLFFCYTLSPGRYVRSLCISASSSGSVRPIWILGFPWAIWCGIERSLRAESIFDVFGTISRKFGRTKFIEVFRPSVRFCFISFLFFVTP